MTNAVIVIGGGVNGLVAATYLAKAGRRVTLLEAQGQLGGLCRTAPLVPGIAAPIYAHNFYALDPRVIGDLKLARHGLRFAVRDMPLVGLRRDGRHVIAGRDALLTARNLAAHSSADAENWPRFRRDLFHSARLMRRLWWNADRYGKPAKPLSHMRRTSANAWLDVRFESEALRSLLTFDATDGGLSPLDAGSSLLLLWRAAQEMCGLQGAVAMAGGGPGALVSALESAALASGVTIRKDARARHLAVEGGKVRGVELESAASVEASIVLSSLSRNVTLRELVRPGDAGFAREDEPEAPKTGCAKVLLAFDGLPAIGASETPQSARFVVAERPESLIEAHEAARAGRLADELVFEFVLPTASDAELAPGKHILSALVRPVPFAPVGGWPSMKALLAAKVLAALERFAPGASRRAIAAKIFAPDEMAKRDGEGSARRHPGHALHDWRERARTPVSNLWLCGADADAVSAVSGRAGRIAARMALHKVFGS
jgi:phytoene dehydrogenase-like protein